MRTRGHAAAAVLVGTHFQQLESRRLLSLTPIVSETEVPGLDTAIQTDVAVAADGSYLVATGGKIGGVGTISAVRYSPAGQQLGTPLTLHTLAASESSISISASMDPDGNAVVAFGTVDGETTNVYIARISAAGVASAADLVDSRLADSQTFEDVMSPSVSMFDDGGFFLGWIHHATRDRHEILMQRYGADGVAHGEVIIAHEGNSPFSQLFDLDIAARPSGLGATFAYFFLGEDSIAQSVNVGQLSTVGPTDEVTAVGNTTSDPSVATFGDGSFLLAYEEHHTFTDLSTSSTESFVQRYDAVGTPIGNPIRLGEALGGTGITSPQIDDTLDGGFVATFIRSTLNSDNVSVKNTLYVTHYNANGVQDSGGGGGGGDDDVPLDFKNSGVRSGADLPKFFADPSFVSPSIGADADGRAVIAYIEGATARFHRVAPDEQAFAFVQDSTLTVLGTTAGDSIRVFADGSNIVVRRGSATNEFDASQVNQILVSGLDGDDTIFNDTALPSMLLGGAGNDKLLGGSGNDSISGGDGKDKLFGRDGRDSLSGNAGNDTCEGGLGADRVAGNGGRDYLYGNGGNDRLYGGAQPDHLYGQGGSNQLFGNGGHDWLYADREGDNGGVDTLNGNDGDDVLVSRDALIDHLFGGDGEDSCIADEDDAINSIESLT
jgi:Ca2+-binding RTX toxin-like protein